MEEKKEEIVEELVYDKAPLYKRWFGAFIDIFIMAALALILYGIAAVITNQVGAYRNVLETRERVQEESGLYLKDGTLITTSLEESDSTIQEKKDELQGIVEGFYGSFLQDDVMAEAYEQRKASACDNLDVPYFTQVDGHYVEGTFPPDVYYDFYKSEIENFAIPALSLVPDYNWATRIVTVTSVVELFLAFAIGYTFSFLLMPLFIRRGRRTVGMFIFKISLIGDDALNVTGKRLVARELLSFFILFCLSCFTFGIPILVSLTMMHLSRNSQSFLDYMTGTYVVDSSKQDVYLDYSEYEARCAGRKEASLENKGMRLTNRKPGTY